MSNYIVINGAIRDVEELSLLIQFINREITEAESASISGIRISTWRSEELRNQSFISWAKSYGIDFVFSDDLTSGGPANYFRQMRTLDNGISDLGDSDIVFKTRTDKALLRKDALRAFVNQCAGTRLSEHLGNRLALEHISFTVPFMAKDMVLLGRADSMRKAISYTERTRYVAESIYTGMGPEVFMWLEYAATRSSLTNILANCDLRAVSNDLVQLTEDSEIIEYFRKNRRVAYLYSLWVETFRHNFTFLSDSLGVREVQPWLIDEGSWKYQIGDREALKRLSRLIPSERESGFGGQEKGKPLSRIRNNPFTALPEEKLEDIFANDSAENSEIVLIRRSIISEFLSEPNPNDGQFRQALQFNIRHRDAATLLEIKSWFLTNNKNLKYVTKEDLIFVLERCLDLSALRGNWSERKELANLARRRGLLSASILLNIAESKYSDRRILGSVFWFSRAWRADPNSLGTNHGLGSILLDLRLTSLALRFLLKASEIAPQDPTAAWTLFRCFVRMRKIAEAKILISRLSDENKEVAKRMLGD